MNILFLDSGAVQSSNYSQIRDFSQEIKPYELSFYCCGGDYKKQLQVFRNQKILSLPPEAIITGTIHNVHETIDDMQLLLKIYRNIELGSVVYAGNDSKFLEGIPSTSKKHGAIIVEQNYKRSLQLSRRTPRFPAVSNVIYEPNQKKIKNYLLSFERTNSNS